MSIHNLPRPKTLLLALATSAALLALALMPTLSAAQEVSDYPVQRKSAPQRVRQRLYRREHPLHQCGHRKGRTSWTCLASR